MPINERSACVRCKHKTLTRADNNPSRSSERSNPLFTRRGRELWLLWFPLPSLFMCFSWCCAIIPLVFLCLCWGVRLWKQRQRWGAACRACVGDVLCSGSGAALWVSLQQKGPRVPCVTSQCHSALLTPMARLRLCGWVLHQLCLCSMQHVPSSSSPPLLKQTLLGPKGSSCF